MEELFAQLEKAFTDYKADLKRFERTRRLADGLFGLGHPLQNDPCHERLDQCVQQAVSLMCSLIPSSADAERAVRFLLRNDHTEWPLAAQWMLRALERHSLSLIPFLRPEQASVLLQEYTERYRPWDRLPVQKMILQALRQQSHME